LGDVLWVEPVIRQLAARFKKVVVYTKYPELFLHYPLSNVRFTSKLRLWEKVMWTLYKAAPVTGTFIDLEHAYEKNPRIHFLSAYQEAAGLPLTREYPRFYLSHEESAFRPPEASNSPYVVIHLESMTDRNYRKVYGVDWRQIVSALRSKGYRVLLLGKDPMPIEDATILKTGIREMIPVIKNAALFIGIDSGPSHLAAALGTPALIFFGAVNPDYRHFRDLLKGRILQQPCEFQWWYHEANAKTGWSCRLVGDEGIPKCAVHTTEYVLKNIDLLITDYQL
jgi:hypothetical protein